MALLLIDVDDGAPAEATGLMGAKTKAGTANAALREGVVDRKTLEAFDRLAVPGS